MLFHQISTKWFADIAKSLKGHSHHTVDTS